MCPCCQGDAETEEHILWHCAAWTHVRDTLMTTVRRLAADMQELPAEPNWPSYLKLCGLAPTLEIFPSPLKEASLSFLISLSHCIRGDTRGAQVAGSTAAGRVNRAHAFQQTERVPTPPHKARSLHASNSRKQELALGTHLHDRYAPVAQSVALAGRTKHSHLFGMGPRF